jgi:biopolymer transport protein ExbD
MAGKLAGAKRGKGMAPNSEPNVIPFIDIMLVLLIIFMVSAPPPTVDVKIDLPPPGKLVYEQPLDKPTTVVLFDYDGVLLIKINDETVTQANFQDRLLAIARENNPSYSSDLAQLFEKAKIFVDADQNTSYNNVIQLINQVDETGFKSVSLLVREAAT